jgi:hypothetical protein
LSYNKLRRGVAMKRKFDDVTMEFVNHLVVKIINSIEEEVEFNDDKYKQYFENEFVDKLHEELEKVFNYPDYGSHI